METAISTLTILPSNKEEIKSYVADVKNQMLSGYADILHVYKQIKVFESVIKTLTDDVDIKNAVMNEAAKYSEKSFKYMGATFATKESGIRYDFSGCNDTELDELTVQIEELSRRKKERETFLKSLKPEIEIFNNNGIKLIPPVKQSSTIVSVTIDK